MHFLQKFRDTRQVWGEPGSVPATSNQINGDAFDRRQQDGTRVQSVLIQRG
jgi:hypothetical protein